MTKSEEEGEAERLGRILSSGDSLGLSPEKKAAGLGLPRWA